jgi:hypothetical protein
MTTQFDYATGTPLAPKLSDFYGESFQMSRRSRRRIPKAIREAIFGAVARANNNRRTRLLDGRRVLQDIALVIEHGAKTGQQARLHLHGGHVANSYGYPAVATASRVVYDPEHEVVLIEVKVANATKGCTGFGRRDEHVDFMDALETADIVIRLY